MIKDNIFLISTIQFVIMCFVVGFWTAVVIQIYLSIVYQFIGDHFEFDSILTFVVTSFCCPIFSMKWTAIITLTILILYKTGVLYVKRIQRKVSTPQA